MKINTARFGVISVPFEEIITMPDGPLGFPECTRFSFVDEEKAKPFRIFQSLDNPTLAFVVIDPFVVCKDYQFFLTGVDLKCIDAPDSENLAIYAIITMASDIKDITVNLQGPIVINTIAKIAHQFVICDGKYTTHEPLVWSRDERN